MMSSIQTKLVYKYLLLNILNRILTSEFISSFNPRFKVTEKMKFPIVTKEDRSFLPTLIPYLT